MGRSFFEYFWQDDDALRNKDAGYDQDREPVRGQQYRGDL
jgi:hypothetical protein